MTWIKNVKNVYYIYEANWPLVLDVFVDGDSNDNSDDSVVPACDEHDYQAQADSEQRQNPQITQQYVSAILHCSF